jgi:integrase
VALEARSGSQRTATEYRRILDRFAQTVEDVFTAPPAAVFTFVHVPGLSGREPSASTINLRLAALTSFYRFAKTFQPAVSNPVEGLQRAKVTEPPPKGLTVAQVERLLEAIPDTARGRRDRAAFMAMLYTGLRRSELLGLTAGDIRNEDGRITWSARVKGGRIRTRTLPTPAYRAICNAWKTTPDQLPADTRLFPITGHGLAKNLQAYADRAGIGRITLHTLRHTAAKVRIQTGASLADVQGLLGHQSMSTTDRYVRRLDGEHDTGWQVVAALFEHAA